MDSKRSPSFLPISSSSSSFFLCCVVYCRCVAYWPKEEATGSTSSERMSRVRIVGNNHKEKELEKGNKRGNRLPRWYTAKLFHTGTNGKVCRQIITVFPFSIMTCGVGRIHKPSARSLSSKKEKKKITPSTAADDLVAIATGLFNAIFQANKTELDQLIKVRNKPETVFVRSIKNRGNREAAHVIHQRENRRPLGYVSYYYYYY